MGGRETKMVVVLVAMITSVDFRSLVSAAQAPTTKDTDTSPQSFNHLFNIKKKEMQDWVHLLKKTTQALLRLSQLIGVPVQDIKLETDGDRTKMDACLVQENDTSPEVVAAAFEVFTKRLNSSSSVATLNDSFHQILCFTHAHAKVVPGTVSEREEASLLRPTITRYVKVLSEHLDAHQRRLHLLNYSFPTPTPPLDHLSGFLLPTMFGATGVDKTLFSRKQESMRDTTPEEKLSQKLIDTIHQLAELVSGAMRVELKFAAAKTAIDVVNEAQAIMTNLKQEVESTQSPTSLEESKIVNFGPYCQNIRDRGTNEKLSKNMLTAVSKAIDQLLHADGATEITTAREELQCRIEAASIFVTMAATSVSKNWKNTLLYHINKVLQDLRDVIPHLEDKADQLPAHLQDITSQKKNFENIAREATAAYLQHHQADTPPPTILKTKVNTFHEVKVGPECCH